MSMSHFKYVDDEYFCEGVSVKKIAEEVGTPAFIYSQSALIDHYSQLDRALSFVPHTICYSTKCNSNIAVCRTLAQAGSGFDIVSEGELYRVLKAGADPKKIVFAGVGKTKQEIETALKKKILCFTVESEPELRLIAQVAERLNKKGAIAIRVNPDVDPMTHKYISTGKGESKFGVDIERAKRLYSEAKGLKSIKIVGIQMHIGSQITTPKPYVDALEKLVTLIKELKKEGIRLKYLDIGGGLGIVYQNEKPATAEEFAQAIRPYIENLGLTLLLEPGRFIAGNAGILVTKVIHVKESTEKKFVIVDAGMNDLIRPSLYEAYHEILPVQQNSSSEEILVDVVGPVCETGDFFAKNRNLPATDENEYLLIKSAGAYAFTMSSNYNSRPRAVEVLVNQDQFAVIREIATCLVQTSRHKLKNDAITK